MRGESVHRHLTRMRSAVPESSMPPNKPSQVGTHSPASLINSARVVVPLKMSRCAAKPDAKSDAPMTSSRPKSAQNGLQRRHTPVLQRPVNRSHRPPHRWSAELKKSCPSSITMGCSKSTRSMRRRWQRHLQVAQQRRPGLARCQSRSCARASCTTSTSTEASSCTATPSTKYRCAVVNHRKTLATQSSDLALPSSVEEPTWASTKLLSSSQRLRQNGAMCTSTTSTKSHSSCKPGWITSDARQRFDESANGGCSHAIGHGGA
mmetsp:Transcript_22125/g.56649  ORF Transcript_22125/g.56649 Transcript_22125/m.56649 type:complete len:263 (+) Transcript_22125:1542-2330(+)